MATKCLTCCILIKTDSKKSSLRCSWVDTLTRLCIANTICSEKIRDDYPPSLCLFFHSLFGSRSFFFSLAFSLTLVAGQDREVDFQFYPTNTR